MSGIVIAQQFCGPPTSGNGGYCAGLLARDLAGPATAVLKARIPLDVTLDLSSDPAGSILPGPYGQVIGEGRPGAPEYVPQPPTPTAWDSALSEHARHRGVCPRVRRL